MGNSTTTLQSVYDWAKAKGIPIPTDQPGGYGTRLALKIGNDVMSAIVAERFNPKWNRAIAPAFLTNSYQQDYPQIGLNNIGWLEEADKLDINNAAFPKPINQPGITVVRQLSRSSQALWPVCKLCWMYNQDLSYGAWPGNGVVFNPLVTSGPVLQNPLMSMKDGNGNLLIVTAAGTTAKPLGAALSPTLGQITNEPGIGDLLILLVPGTPPAWLNLAQLSPFNFAPGSPIYFSFNVTDPGLVYAQYAALAGLPLLLKLVTTGIVIGGNPYYGLNFYIPNSTVSTPQIMISGTVSPYTGAPLLPAGSAEGTVFSDGTVPWTVAAPMSQGFRVFPLPGATGPVYEITAYYQMLLEKMSTLQSLINPIPDDQSYIYQAGVEWMCKMGSSNPQDRAEGMKNWPLWLDALGKLLKQNDREIDAYDALPAESPVESVYGPYRGLRNPQDPSQPY